MATIFQILQMLREFGSVSLLDSIPFVTQPINFIADLIQSECTLPTYSPYEVTLPLFDLVERYAWRLSVL